MKRLACAIVLAGSAYALTGTVCAANAAPARQTDKLSLSILSPDPASIGDRLSLDVSYRGGTVETVELYLDNALVAQRRINAMMTRGIISFSLDTVMLAAGSHDVTVKAFGADGKPIVTSGKLRIPAADLSAPVRIAYPQNGTVISGVIPIRVSLDTDLMKQKPYVTFFVDKELKVLRNYPPYEYAWDTTKVSNGWHMVEAWTTTQDSLTPTKARPIHVNVNNGGGETKKLNAIEDLRTPGKPPINEVVIPIKKDPSVDPLTAVTGTNTTAPDVKGHTPDLGGGITLPEVGTGTRITEPTGTGLGSTSIGRSLPMTTGQKGITLQIGPRMAGPAATEPGKRLPITRADGGLVLGTQDTTPLIPLHPGSSINGTTTIRPGETLSDISRRTGVSTQELARLNNLQDGGRLHGRQLIVPRGGAFEVAFDGTPIAFDVRPRIEGGLKLAPFRQIFEHTGGRLYWFGGSSQTVRAINDTREIELKIGDTNATVNNKLLKLDRSPFIESGRTIVPLSFIRDSMDVKINFDEKTGRLLIESKK